MKNFSISLFLKAADLHIFWMISKIKTVILNTFYVRDIDNVPYFYVTHLWFLVYHNIFPYSTHTGIDLSFSVLLKDLLTHLTHSALY